MAEGVRVMWFPDDFERLAALCRLITGWLRMRRTRADSERLTESSNRGLCPSAESVTGAAAYHRNN
jgi:hypothetical protein